MSSVSRSSCSGMSVETRGCDQRRLVGHRKGGEGWIGWRWIPRWEMLAAGIGQGESLENRVLFRFRLGTIYKERGRV